MYSIHGCGDSGLFYKSTYISLIFDHHHKTYNFFLNISQVKQKLVFMWSRLRHRNMNMIVFSFVLWALVFKYYHSVLKSVNATSVCYSGPLKTKKSLLLQIFISVADVNVYFLVGIRTMANPSATLNLKMWFDLKMLKVMKIIYRTN